MMAFAECKRKLALKSPEGLLGQSATMPKFWRAVISGSLGVNGMEEQVHLGESYFSSNCTIPIPNTLRRKPRWILM
jgi:hypothetical protein